MVAVGRFDNPSTDNCGLSAAKREIKMARRKKSRPGTVVVAVVLGLAIFGAWTLWQSHGRSVTGTVDRAERAAKAAGKVWGK